MNRALQRVNHYLKVLLCIVLILQIQFFTGGCGVAIFPTTTPDGWVRVDLAPDHPLNKALHNSRFAGAAFFDVRPDEQAFRLVYPDDARSIAGQYELVNEQFTIRQLHVEADGHYATLKLNRAKQVVAISTSDGDSWMRSDESDAKPINARLADAQDYLTANADLLQTASELDLATGYGIAPGSYSGPYTGGSSVAEPSNDPGAIKTETTGNVSRLSLPVVLLVLAAIWAPLLGVFQPLAAIFMVGAIIDGLIPTRFDGQWAATNGQGDMTVTISAGRIVQIVETAGNQEFELIYSQLVENAGDRIVWRVIARIPGQSVDVELTFDMQELNSNTLEGTLTAMGDDTARVPLTMTRM